MRTSGDSTRPGRRVTAHWVLGAATTVALAVASIVLVLGLSPGSVVADRSVPVAQVEPVVIAAGATPVTPVARSAEPQRSASSAPERTSPPRPTRQDEDRSTDAERGCGRAAVSAGSFDPSCSEYQGYLDPGEAGGRAQTSGESQFEWGCEQGYIPETECD